MISLQFYNIRGSFGEGETLTLAYYNLIKRNKDITGNPLLIVNTKVNGEEVRQSIRFDTLKVFVGAN